MKIPEEEMIPEYNEIPDPQSVLVILGIRGPND